MELKILNSSNQAGESIQVSDTLFARDYNESLIHQLVVSFMANARSGTRAVPPHPRTSHRDTRSIRPIFGNKAPTCIPGS